MTTSEAVSKVFRTRGPSPRPGATGTRAVDLALIAVAVAWGSSYLAAKEVATPDTVLGFLSVRFAVAVAALALFIGPRLRATTRTELCCGGGFGLVLAAIFALETFGVTMTSASNAGLIISLTIVLTPILENTLRRAGLPAHFYGASALAVAGVVLLTQSGGFTIPNTGDTLILLAALARAVHVTAIAHFSEGHELDSGRMTLIQLTTVFLVFTCLAPIFGQSPTRIAAEFSLADWTLTIYLSLACTVFAFLTQMWAVRRTSPARVSLLLGTEPLWAAAIGISLAGDPVTAVSLCGAALVLIGTYWGRSIDNQRQATT